MSQVIPACTSVPLLFSSLVLAMALPSARAHGEDDVCSVPSGGYLRSYVLHVPPQARPGDPLPLVIALHGGRMSVTSIAHTSQLSPLADRAGFIVAYPNGIHNQWADGRGTTWPDQHGVNDVAFISDLIDDVQQHHHPIDALRIYATGMSSGGMLTHRLGLELGRRIAAIAPVAACLPVGLAVQPPPTRPVAVMMFSGTADPDMPYGGGAVVSGGEVLSADDTIVYWKMVDQIDQGGAPPVVTDLPNADPNDGCTVVQTWWEGGMRRDCVLEEIIGGGHTWPGQPPSHLPRLGPVCEDISATSMMWAFFVAHPKAAAEDPAILRAGPVPVPVRRHPYLPRSHP